MSNLYGVKKMPEGLNFEEQLKYIVNVNDQLLFYEFISNIDKSLIDKAADIIIETKNGNFINLFATFVKGAPIKKLADAIIKTKNSFCIYCFARDVKGAPVKKLAKVIIALKESEYIYLFAKDVKNAPIQKLADAIIKTNDAHYIYSFAQYVKGASIQKLADAIIKTKNSFYIYSFARDVKGAPIDKLTDAIIETKDAHYIYSFAKNVKGAPIDKLLLAYLKLTDIRTLCDFIKGNVQYISFIKIYNALVKNRIWLSLDNLKFLEPVLKKYIEEISPPNITEMFELELEIDSFYGNGQKYIYKGTFQDDLATKNKIKDMILSDLESKMKSAQKIRKIATKSIDKPKINEGKPKKYVRAKKK